MEILQQTDEFLREMGAKVLLQKKEKADQEVEDEVHFEKADSKDAFSLMKSNKVYYNLTHTIKEKIEK